MDKIVGKQILVKRGRLLEVMIVENVEQLLPSVFSISGRNEKRTMTITMTKEEIELNLQ